MRFLLSVLNLYIERYDFFIKLLLQHIFLSFLAIIFITIIGLSLGIYMTRNEKMASVVLGVANFLYTIPSLALFGLLVPIAGIGNKNALIALTVYGVLPLIRNTYVGINEVDEQIIESAIGMGSTDKQLLFKVQLPIALPVIMAGFRTMVVMTIALVAIAAFIGAGGLGAAIYRGISTYFSEMIFAGSLLIALLAIVSDWILGMIERKIRKKLFGIKKKELI